METLPEAALKLAESVSVDPAELNPQLSPNVALGWEHGDAALPIPPKTSAASSVPAREPVPHLAVVD